MRSFSQEGPILDINGQTIYEEKHRKPKWVTKNELGRFNKHIDETLSVENSRNNRIRMEDPFIRKVNDKYVFTHIQDTDIAKYIIGQSYLSKRVLNTKDVIGIHPDLLS